MKPINYDALAQLLMGQGGLTLAAMGDDPRKQKGINPLNQTEGAYRPTGGDSGLRFQADILGRGQKRLQEEARRNPNPPPRDVQDYVVREAARLGVTPEYLYSHMLRTQLDPRIPRYDNIWMNNRIGKK